jgi:hypothetical protein
MALKIIAAKPPLHLIGVYKNINNCSQIHKKQSRQFKAEQHCNG